MQGKKLNLLPQAVKSRYTNRYMIYGTTLVCGSLVIALLFLYANMGVLSLHLNRLEKENAQYNSEKAKMENFQIKILEHKSFLEAFERSDFPFAKFMHDLELHRPFGVSILSVDSVDRLINEGASEESENAEELQQKLPKVEYKKDIKGERIVIRGFSDNQEAISKFIYNVSNLGYVNDALITAIEQHELDGMLVNIFEFSIMGGAIK